MIITLNGEARTVADGTTAAALVEELGLAGRRIAMEVNREIVPRSTFESHALNDGDQVEIVHAIGGG
ncbi:sulfur carrier protein ThiS [Endothiovibrio diazotrophicus]